jgi:hypothetical protein
MPDGSATSKPDGPAPGEDEREELARLRAEVAALRARPQPDGRVAARRTKGRWRTSVAALLIVVACVLAPLSVLAVWTRNLIGNTDRYVDTVAPLASNPDVQNAIANQITAQIFNYINVQELTTQAADALDSRGAPRAADGLRALAGPIANGVQGFTRDQVGKVVASDAFAQAWVQANRVAHTELVKALTGEGGGAVTVKNDTVSVNLAAFIQTVKQQLTAAGFGLAARIPEVNASFTVFQSDQIPRAQSGFHLLKILGVWLPIIVLVLIAIGVYVAKSHRRALVGAALGLVIAMFVLALGLALFRGIYLDSVPSNILPHDAAAALYDTIVRFLRLGLRTVVVLGLVVAAGAFLTGPSVTAARTRQGLARGIGWLRSGATSVGFRTGPVGTWVQEHKPLLRGAAVALVGLMLVFWGRPTGKVVIFLTALLLFLLAVIEFLGQPATRAGPAPTTE